MINHKIISFEKPAEFADPLHDFIRTGARQLIQTAIECELEGLLEQFQDSRTEAAVVSNGYLPERALQTGIGPVSVRIPKVRSRTGEAVTFRSALVPP